MALLIDGYNLLHVTGLFGRGPNASFEASRAALLGFLATAIDAAEREATTIVFDAAHAPPGLPNLYTVGGIRVHYARNYESADELLEELIAAHHSPRKLTVVSSDHRVQRAAKKRKAIAVDSHVWYQATAEQWKQRLQGATELPDIKPDEPPTSGEVQAWLRFFGPIDVQALAREDVFPVAPTVSTARPRKKTLPAAKKVTSTKKTVPPRAAKIPRSKKPAARRIAKKRGKPKDLGFGDIANPFPPGYGEDVAES